MKVSYDLAPRNSFIYYSWGQGISPSYTFEHLGVPTEWIAKGASNRDWGVFRDMYHTWIAYTEKTTRPYKSANATLVALWPWELEPRALECVLNHARFTVNLTFEEGRPNITQNRLDLVGPILHAGETMVPESPQYKTFA